MDSVGKRKGVYRKSWFREQDEFGWKNMSAKVVGGPGGEGRRYGFGSTQ